MWPVEVEGVSGAKSGRGWGRGWVAGMVRAGSLRRMTSRGRSGGPDTPSDAINAEPREDASRIWQLAAATWHKAARETEAADTHPQRAPLTLMRD